MAKKAVSAFITSSKSFINAPSTKEKYRVKMTDFTRNRKLPFEQLVLCMLKLLRKSLVLELRSFFNKSESSTNKMTSSAFVQSRKKLKPDLFYDLNQVILKEYYTDNDENVKLYKGMRVLSIDGSTLGLPFSKDILKHYSTYNNQNKTEDVDLGRVSVLYDVLNNMVLDGYLRPFSQGENTIAMEHIQYAQKGDLIIMDRNYPSFNLAWHMQQQGIDFLFRCQTGFSNKVKEFYESGKRDEIIHIQAKRKKSFKNLPYDRTSYLKVRMLRIELDSGEAEILMTSLLDKKEFPHKIFKDLYFKRWGVETFYDHFKNIIGVEQFSGTSHQFIQQEFNCALYMSNMQSILTQDAEDQVEEKYKKRKYEYKVNRSLALGFIRERLIEIYTSEHDSETVLEELKELFIENVVPIRPGRKNKRDVDKYRRRTKPKQFKNRRGLL
ncbi:MAG: IS4 family transposase [Crocinitomicaceae bacterium]|nr:IS4 family transposase [Crocinitomicaceae bacterium]